MWSLGSRRPARCSTGPSSQMRRALRVGGLCNTGSPPIYIHFYFFSTFFHFGLVSQERRLQSTRKMLGLSWQIRLARNPACAPFASP